MAVEGSGRTSDAPAHGVVPPRPTLDLGGPIPASESGVEDRSRTRPSSRPLPSEVGGRYSVSSLLGRGGSAAVYRATDLRTGREVALKQLSIQGEDRHGLGPLFEREFHMLAQISHPSVIEVYDYAIDERGPFYTMELLGGGDLRELAPLPWREVCALIYDVCSSLALLHSRRFVHRDVSPRNVRRTEHGVAKLIDFGAMAPMGATGQLVGTPPFVPPEALHRVALDARTDLYALGATMYYALTRRMAYPARDFASLTRVWAAKPPLPSAFSTEIPPALDALVMSLLSLEQALRPRSAFEVMEKLSAIAGLDRRESAEVARAYLSTPLLVGRENELGSLRTQFRRMLGGRGGVALVTGVAGIGRSRLLDACALEAKTLGATVLHASAGLSDDAFAACQAFGEQLIEAMSEVAIAAMRAEQVEGDLLREATDQESADDRSMAAPRARLRDLSAPDLDRTKVQKALERWILRVSRSHSLVLLADDVHALDDASVALLAALANGAEDRKLCVVAAVESGAIERAPIALAVLRARAESIALEALSSDDTTALLESLFGDVPHLPALSARVFEIAAGNPRTSIAVAQHLVDHNVVRYAGGAWSLPERLEDGALPTSGADAYAKQLETLSPAARFIVETQALALQVALRRDHYVRLAPHLSAREIDDALTDLVTQQVLSSDGRAYRLKYRGWAAALALGGSQRTERHRALASLYQSTDRSALVGIHHLLLAGEPEQALELLRAHFVREPLDSQDLPASNEALTSVDLIAQIYQRCLQAAQQLARPKPEQMEIRLRMLAVSVVTDPAYFYAAAPELLTQLRHDSGLDLWESMADVADPGARLGAALTKAFERYGAAPEAERVYRPDEAIKLMVRFVAVAIAIGGSWFDGALLRTLPGLLEPFTPLSKVADAVHRNAFSAREGSCFGRSVSALAKWRDTFERLSEIAGDELRYVGYVRNATAFACGAIESSLGIATAASWAERLDGDPMQHVSAMYLRRVMALQQGDRDLADTYRRRAEVLAVQTATRQMFTTLLVVELTAYAHAGDLEGVRELGERITALCAKSRPWNSYRHLAEGYYERLRGDLPAALQAFDKGFPYADPDPNDHDRVVLCWPRLVAARVETLVALDRCEEAEAFGRESLARWRALEFDLGGHEISRALAIAEGKLGHFDRAAARLDALIAEQRALGVAGLNLGASHEARTRIAIWSGDTLAVEEHGRFAAREYRHGRGSPLGARYERLMDEARVAGVRVLPQLSAFETKLTTSSGTGYEAALASVEHRMEGVTGAGERARRALRMACDARGASGGHLFLGTSERLELVASIGNPPDDELRATMHEYLRAHAVDESHTEVLTTEGGSLPGTTHAYGRDRPVSLLPVLLSYVHDGHVMHVGVLALELSERQQTSLSTTPLLEALAIHLARQGDIPGLSVNQIAPVK